MLRDSNVIEFFTNEMVLAKINGEKDSLLKAQYRVSAFPTLVMLDSNGAEVDRIVGYEEPTEFLTTLRNYRKGVGTLADLLNQAETKPDRSLAFEIAEKYKYRGAGKNAAGWYQKVIDTGNPADSLSGESRMALADMYRRAKDYDKALDAFSSIMKDFGGEFFALDAELWIGIIYKQKGDTVSAIKAYEDFIKHYPESEDVEWVQKQIKKLKGEPEEEEKK